jgi:hypothetical protein
MPAGGSALAQQEEHHDVKGNDLTRASSRRKSWRSESLSAFSWIVLVGGYMGGRAAGIEKPPAVSGTKTDRFGP